MPTVNVEDGVVVVLQDTVKRINHTCKSKYKHIPAQEEEEVPSLDLVLGMEVVERC